MIRRIFYLLMHFHKARPSPGPLVSPAALQPTTIPIPSSVGGRSPPLPRDDRTAEGPYDEHSAERLVAERTPSAPMVLLTKAAARARDTSKCVLLAQEAAGSNAAERDVELCAWIAARCASDSGQSHRVTEVADALLVRGQGSDYAERAGAVAQKILAAAIAESSAEESLAILRFARERRELQRVVTAHRVAKTVRACAAMTACSPDHRQVATSSSTSRKEHERARNMHERVLSAATEEVAAVARRVADGELVATPHELHGLTAAHAALAELLIGLDRPRQALDLLTKELPIRMTAACGSHGLPAGAALAVGYFGPVVVLSSAAAALAKRAANDSNESGLADRKITRDLLEASLMMLERQLSLRRAQEGEEEVKSLTPIGAAQSDATRRVVLKAVLGVEDAALAALDGDPFDGAGFAQDVLCRSHLAMRAAVPLLGAAAPIATLRSFEKVLRGLTFGLQGQTMLMAVGAEDSGESVARLAHRLASQEPLLHATAPPKTRLVRHCRQRAFRSLFIFAAAASGRPEIPQEDRVALVQFCQRIYASRDFDSTSFTQFGTLLHKHGLHRSLLSAWHNYTARIADGVQSLELHRLVVLSAVQEGKPDLATLVLATLINKVADLLDRHADTAVVVEGRPLDQWSALCSADLAHAVKRCRRNSTP